MNLRKAFLALSVAFIMVTATSMGVMAAENNDVIVFDERSAWTDYTVIDLFERNELGAQLVYPGVTGYYTFTVCNMDSKDHECEVIIGDENNFSISLDIRIKRDGEYIVGSESDWKKSANFDSGVYLLSPKASSIYELEWKWDYYISDDYDNRDTSFGKRARYETEPYNVKINVLADVESLESSQPSTLSDPSNASDPSNTSNPSYPSTPSNSSNPQISQPDDKPTTGDSQNIWIFVSIVLSSSAALAITVIKKKSN